VRLVGDPAIPKGLIDDPEVEDRLNDEIEGMRAAWNDSPTTAMLLRRYPNLMGWLRRVFTEMGLALPHLVDPEANPWDLRDADPAVLATGVSLYLARDVDAPTTRGDLLTWTSRDVRGTALEALYRERSPGPEPHDTPIESP
jgi:hypothetical protein